MAFIVNECGRDLEFYYGGVTYKVEAGQEAEIPDIVASLYLGFGIAEQDLASMIDTIIARLKACNPSLAAMSNKDIWDKIVLNVHFGKRAIEEVKKKARK
ncbi:MAG: hypothetical protein RMI01_08775 [Thermodesulfovibrio sp.]|nr:hypothetical protein [Thermodesulfovibrio sp.]